jgi:hypothetical protein
MCMLPASSYLHAATVLPDDLHTCLPAHLPVCRYAVGVYDKQTNTLQLAKPAGGSVSCHPDVVLVTHSCSCSFVAVYEALLCLNLFAWGVRSTSSGTMWLCCCRTHVSH